MFTIHLVSVIIILVFLLYNGISENGTITHKYFVDFKLSIDQKTAKLILKLKEHSITSIIDITAHKFRYLPIILFFGGGILICIFEKTKFAAYASLVIIVSMVFMMVGFTSAKQLFKGVLTGLKNLLFVSVLALLLLGILWLDSDKQSIVELKNLFVTPVVTVHQTAVMDGIVPAEGNPWLFIGFLLLALAFLYLCFWVIIRVLTITAMFCLVSLSKFCFWLNTKSPLKPFYLIFQFTSVLFTEIIAKALK